ncbi:hypothetical protein GALL_465910 [mine drainage metagenome]|uniref:Uncharacterized protein n=1 Tax=mine drainage metagenome TaxID=410659 RepID=A0A1J5Q771_9ZZZZ
MIGILLVVGIMAFLAFAHARNNYQHQVNAWDGAVERAVQEKLKMHQDVAKHVKNILVQEGFAIRTKETPAAMSGQRSATAEAWPAQAASASAAAVEQPSDTKKASVTPLQEGTGRIVFLGEVPDPVKGYDVFTCRLLGKDGEVEFRGAQLKGESLRMGDLVTIRRLPSESITQTDGSTKRKNRFEVIQLDVTPEVAEESQADPVQASAVGK